MDTVSDPRSTLVVVLGASEFPRSRLKPSKAFREASESLCSYFLSGFELPIENLFAFFDSGYDPDTLDDQLATRLTNRMQQLDTAGTPAMDLIVYYVGHGSFDEQRRYYLALRSTREENQSVSSLRFEALNTTLNTVGRSLRKFVIIDACFAGEAAYTQSDVAVAVDQQIKLLPQTPRTGTAFLCSSSRDLVSEFLADESNTKFTKALCEALWDGDSELPPKVSFDQLQSLTERRLASGSPDSSRPELHTPQQSEGNIARIPIFPNGPRRTRSLAAAREQEAKQEKYHAYLRSQEEEQARHAEKIAEENRARDKESRERLLEQQERARSIQALSQKRYDSDVQKEFREEAESPRDRALNLALLVSWLDWKASESQIAAGALRRDSKDHLEEASQSRAEASNLASWMEVYEKSGSSEQVQLAREEIQKLLKKAQREESKAKDRNDDAEIAEIESSFYRNAKASIDLINRTAEEAQRSGRSFQELVGLELSPIIHEVHRRHRIRDRWVTFRLWTRRAVVTLVGVCLAAIALRSCGTPK